MKKIVFLIILNFLYSDIIKLANKYYNNGQFSKAEYLYKKALKQGENKAVIYYNLANMYYLMTNISKSLDYYKKVINYAPGFKDSYMNIAKIYYLYENYNDSINIIKQYLTIQTNDFDAYIMLGDVYKKIRSFEKADYCYNKSISINKTNNEAYISYAKLYLQLSDYDTALNIINRGINNIVDINNSYKLFKIQSDIYKLQGKYSDAAIILQFIINKIKLEKQDKIYLYNQLSELLINAGYINSGINILKKSISEQPDNVNTILHLDMIYFNNKKYNEAFEFYVKLYKKNKFQSYKLIKKLLIYAYNNNDTDLSKKILKFYKQHNIKDNISNLFE